MTKFPSSGLEENYCRKTANWFEIWCLTTDPSTKWELCNVPACDDEHKQHGACKDGYIPLGEACIRLVPIKKSFGDAQKSCEAEGATLAMPKTKRVDLILRAMVRSTGGKKDHWIGMCENGSFDKHVLGNWKWVDGSRLATYDYQGWNPGEPNGYGSQCVQYLYAGYSRDGHRANKEIEAKGDCEDQDSNLEHHADEIRQTGTQRIAPTKLGIYSQLLENIGIVGNKTYGPDGEDKMQEPSTIYPKHQETKEESRDISEFHDDPENDVCQHIKKDEINNSRRPNDQRSDGGQSTTEDADNAGCGGAGVLENPMYGKDVSQQDDGKVSAIYPKSEETREESPDTGEFHNNNVCQNIDNGEISNQRQSDDQSPHGDQKAAEDADTMGCSGAGLVENSMYAQRVLQQDDGKNSRQASDQSAQEGQPTEEDADKMSCNGAGLFENPMYATVPSTVHPKVGETKEESPGTSDCHDYPNNHLYHYIDRDETDNLPETGVQSKYDGQPTAASADKVGCSGSSLFENPMYAQGVLQQDDGDSTDGADNRGFPARFNLKSHHTSLLLFVIIAATVATVFGAAAALITYSTTMQEAHPPSFNSSLERSDTSSRPVSPAPATNVGPTLENKNETFSPYITVTADSTNSTALPTWMTADESCKVGDWTSYRGTVSVTVTGKTCQRWDSQTPHEHDYMTKYGFPPPELEENYCRKTADFTEIWCFTTDPSTRWELCNIPACGKV
ncbi:apolipoprotein(a)-like [Branchiostoma lanceolatum]|uniref:apolipoprotein(a)-like n=1 Tax=Branchiostoma lanceolatum TaxID=7740 RepID=UPI0034541615